VSVENRRTLADNQQKKLIYLADIVLRPRWRQSLRREALEKLKDSFRRIGLQVPITVRPTSDEKSELIAGLHRLTAYQELNSEEPGGRWEKIPVGEVDCTDDEATMLEISENLDRAELTVAERSLQIAEWIRLCQKRDAPKDKPAQLEPVSAKGGRGQEGGIKAAARELGVERNEAQRAVKIASLAPEAKAEAEALRLDDNQTALLKAAGQPDAVAQVKSLQEHAAARAAPRPARRAKPKPNIEIDGKPASPEDVRAIARRIVAEAEPERAATPAPASSPAAEGGVINDDTREVKRVIEALDKTRMIHRGYIWREVLRRYAPQHFPPTREPEPADPVTDAIVGGSCEPPSLRRDQRDALAEAWSAADFDTRADFLMSRVAVLTPKRFVRFVEWFDEYRKGRNPDGSDVPDDDEGASDAKR
jgi:hypothetical protein